MNEINDTPAWFVAGCPSGLGRALAGVSESLAAKVRPLELGVSIVQTGPFRRFLETMSGRQPGHPSKAARANIAAAASGAAR